MNLPVTEYYPDDPDQLPPSRRRRARRLLAPLNADERADFLDHLAHRVSPSFDFFFFSVLAGAVIGLGLLLDSTPLLVLAAVLAPVMAPVVGMALGTVMGSARFFVRSLLGLVIGGLLVFIVGMGAGFISQYWETLKLGQVSLFTRVSWANLVVLAVGAIITTAAMTHVDHKPLVSSVALSFELYTPLAVAGFGLSSGVPDLWPDGLLIFAAHLAWAALFGALTLAVMGFRPLTLFGYTLGGAVMLLGVILLIEITSLGAAISTNIASPTPSPVIYTSTPTRVITPVPPTATPTPTWVTPTETLTPAPTDTEAPTSTPTPTPTATPMYALVNASEESGGLRLRASPGLAGEIIRLYINGTLLQVLPDTVEADGVIWAHVIVVSDGAEGWMQQYYLLVATPAPNW